MPSNEKTTIQISERVRIRLRFVAAYRNITYEDLLDEFTEREIAKIKPKRFANQTKKDNKKNKR